MINKLFNALNNLERIHNTSKTQPTKTKTQTTSNDCKNEGKENPLMTTLNCLSSISSTIPWRKIAHPEQSQEPQGNNAHTPWRKIIRGDEPITRTTPSEDVERETRRDEYAEGMRSYGFYTDTPCCGCELPRAFIDEYARKYGYTPIDKIVTINGENVHMIYQQGNEFIDSYGRIHLAISITNSLTNRGKQTYEDITEDILRRPTAGSNGVLQSSQTENQEYQYLQTSDYGDGGYGDFNYQREKEEELVYVYV